MAILVGLTVSIGKIHRVPETVSMRSNWQGFFHRFIRNRSKHVSESSSQVKTAVIRFLLKRYWFSSGEEGKLLLSVEWQVVRVIHRFQYRFDLLESWASPNRLRIGVPLDVPVLDEFRDDRTDNVSSQFFALLCFFSHELVV